MSVEDLAKAREELSKSRSMVLDDNEVYEEEDKAKSETEVSYSSKLPEWFVQEKVRFLELFILCTWLFIAHCFFCQFY